MNTIERTSSHQFFLVDTVTNEVKEKPVLLSDWEASTLNTGYAANKSPLRYQKQPPGIEED